MLSSNRGGQVILQALGQPPVKFQSPLAAFEKALGAVPGPSRVSYMLNSYLSIPLIMYV